jgi:enterochelin esterase family protein
MMAPVIAVFVAPADRQPEYAGDRIDEFTQFITGELMPALDSLYPTSREPSKRAMFGVSDGGNIALYIGLKHPEQFGKIAAQSSDVIKAVSKGFASGKKSSTEFYLDIGTYDIPQLLPMVRGMRDILKSKGYSYTYHEWHEGHSWCNWSNHLSEPLVQFFPVSGGSGK